MLRTTVLRGAASLVLLASVLGACSSANAVAPTATEQVPAATQANAATSAPVPAGDNSSLDLDGPTGLCAIFPSDRAAGALGEPVGRGSTTHSVTFGNADCHYGSTASDASITIWYHAGLTRSEWEKSMVKVGMTPAMSVAGIGEAAYRRDGTAAHPRVKLATFEGDHDIWVVIEDPAGIETLAATAEREARELLTALR